MAIKRRYCPRCNAITERRPNGRCAPCQRNYNRIYMRSWKAADNSWLDTRERCPTCKQLLPRKR